MSETSVFRRLSGRRVLAGFMSVAYLCTVLSRALGISPNLFAQLTPFFLIVVSAICLWEYRKSWNTSFSIWFFSTFAGLIAVEIIGVKTGFPFGHYAYTSVLGPGVLGVPLIIGLNWVLVLLGAIQIVALFPEKWNKCVKSLFVAVICTIFDIILERVAMKLGYWEWRSGIIPMQNYIAWFVLSFLFSMTFWQLERPSRKFLARINLLHQLVFFLLIIVLKP